MAKRSSAGSHIRQGIVIPADECYDVDMRIDYKFRKLISQYVLLIALFIIAFLSLCGCSGDARPPGADMPVAGGAPEQSGSSAGAVQNVTEPSESAAPFVFLFMSDTQADPLTGDYSAFGAMLARAVADRKPELLLLGGDTVNDGADEDEWRAFWDAAGPALEGLAVAAAAGNHDNKTLLAGQFTLPDAAPEQPGRGWFYSFDMSNVHFIVLDSNIMGAAKAEDIAWLEADLAGEAAASADWRVAVCHHPFLTVIASPKDEARAQTMRDSFLPLLIEYGVDLLLVGHQHNYARSLPMRGSEPARPDSTSARAGESGLVQVMVASGGKASYTHDARPYLALTAEAPNYLALSADFGTLSVAAYDADGVVIDAFVLGPAAPSRSQAAETSGQPRAAETADPVGAADLEETNDG